MNYEPGECRPLNTGDVGSSWKELLSLKIFKNERLAVKRVTRITMKFTNGPARPVV